MYQVKQCKLSDQSLRLGRTDSSIAAMQNNSFVIGDVLISKIHHKGHSEILYVNKEGVIDSKNSLQNIVDTNYKSQSLCVLNNQNIVIVWARDLADGSGLGIQARIETANGTVIKNDFLVNNYTYLNQYSPNIEALKDGSVIVFQSLHQESPAYNTGIYAQKFDQLGNKIGEEFRVNEYIFSNQELPKIAVNKEGSFLIIWQSYNQDGSGKGVYARLYDKNAIALTSEFIVNLQTAGNQDFPDVTAIEDNSFVCTWQNQRFESEGHDIYMQIINKQGQMVGPQQMVNDATDIDMVAPSVFSTVNNSVMIIWQENFGQSNALVIKAYYVDYNVTNVTVEVAIPQTAISGTDGIDPQARSLYMFSSTGKCAPNGNCLVVGTFLDNKVALYKSNIWFLSLSLNTAINSTVSNEINNTVNATISDTSNNYLSLAVNGIEMAPSATADTTIVTNLPNDQTATNQNSTNQTAPTQTGLNIPITATVVEQLQNISRLPVMHASTTAPINNTELLPAVTNAANQTELVNATIIGNPQTTVPTNSTVANITETNASVTNTTTTNTVEAHTTSTNATEIFVGNYSNIEIVNGTNVIVNGTDSTVTEYVFTNYVKYAVIYNGGESDSFVFAKSSNSYIEIENFGNMSVLNLTALGNYSAMSDLNITSGSTHIHLPGNQTIVIANKYPNELKESNFIFANSKTSYQSTAAPITAQAEMTEAMPNQDIGTNDKTVTAHGNSSLTIAEILGIAATGVLVSFGIGGIAVACVSSYRHREAVTKTMIKAGTIVANGAVQTGTYIKDHLPFGHEQGDEQVSNAVIANSASTMSEGMKSILMPQSRAVTPEVVEMARSVASSVVDVVGNVMEPISTTASSRSTTSPPVVVDMQEPFSQLPQLLGLDND